MSGGHRNFIVIILILLIVFCVALAGLQGYSRQVGYCANCHIIKSYVDSWISSEYLDHKHKEIDISCNDCHPRTIRKTLWEIQSYIKKDYEIPLLQKKDLDKQCLKCHESFIKAIIDQKHQAKSAKINPHAYPVDIQNPDNPHASPNTQPECYRCHKIHSKSPGIKYCYRCHHSGNLAKCSKCH